jgi:hypothetical protein
MLPLASCLLLAAAYRVADIGHAYPLMRGVAPVSGGLRPTALVLLTETVIAAYTLVDGLGVQPSGAPAAYTAWIFLFAGTGIAALAWRRSAGQLPAYPIRHPGPALMGGAATTGSYGIASWAMTQAPAWWRRARRRCAWRNRDRQSELQLIVRLDAHRARIIEAALLDAGNRIGVGHLEARILVRQVR